jgi:U3 small nucleolar RNA-associated protein 12
VNYEPPTTKATSCTNRGTLYRQGRDRPIPILSHSRRELIAVHGSDNLVELLRIRSENQVKKVLSRKWRWGKEQAYHASVPDSGVGLANVAE